MNRLLLLVVSFMACACSFGANVGDGVVVSVEGGALSVSFLKDDAVRLKFFDNVALMSADDAEDKWLYAERPKKKVKFKRQDSGNAVVLTTDEMVVVVDKESGNVEVKDEDGRSVLKTLSHALKKAKVQELDTRVATLTLASPTDEFLYGLGQFQDGLSNLRGQTRRLTQVNSQIAMPFMLSSKGYALLWNNYGLTEFNPSDTKVEMVRASEEGNRTTVDVTSTEGGKRETRISNRFSATVNIPADGDYAILLDVGQSMARRHNLVIDGETVTDVRNVWLPPTTSMVRHLSAGKHTFSAELERNDKPVLWYKKVDGTSVLRSPVADCVDYTVFVGSADEAIASYRSLTGQSPMLPQWAYGYVHCRERYHSQDDLLQNARTFRERKLPIDVIVQDWQYWGKYGWNAMRFDEQHYPSPAKMVDDLHGMNIRLMLSVWSKVDGGSELGKQIQQRGYYIPGTTWVDFFNPEAAKFYWTNFSEKLLKPFKIDAWWQDATEPENDDLVGRRIMGGKLPGEIYRNVYPLLVSKTVFEGLRADDPGRRAMILTRSGFPGIQRYGSVLWTGDVGNDWETLRRQIASGLGMMSSGHPWWTYDAGGFFRPYDQHRNQAYIECMLRWIETSVFFPMMRVHGYQSDTEPWRYGAEAERMIADNLALRYKLLPYIYSGAADVCFNGSTLMRPLVFDFADDKEALKQKHTFMFGKSMLVSPVTEAGAKTWTTYLPDTDGGWFDFWTNKKYDDGQNVTTPVTLDKIPVFVKAGSILPIGPERQYTGEKLDEPVELRVYPGDDASFALYEDEGDNYNYEKGAYSIINMEWDDDDRTLVIGKRKGEFEGMQKERQFRIVTPDGKRVVIDYTGRKVTVKL